MNLPYPLADQLIEGINRDGGRYVRVGSGIGERVIEYFVYGSDAPDARVMIELHGSNQDGSNFADPKVFHACHQKLLTLNIRGISVSCPGQGFTSVGYPSRRLIDWPRTDLGPVLVQEGVKKFMVHGISAGSGYAMATASYFGADRVTALGLVGPWVPNPIVKEFNLPPQAEEIPSWITDRWTKTSAFAPLWRVVMKFVPFLTRFVLLPVASKEECNGYKDECTTLFRTMINRTYLMLPAGPTEAVHDLMWGDWGFDPRSITGIKVLVSYMPDDHLNPALHAKWLAEHLKAQKVIVGKTGVGHLGLLPSLISGNLQEALASF